MKHYLFSVLCCLFLLTGFANASEYLSIDASYGWVAFHPEAATNNYIGHGASWRLGFDKSIKEETSVLITLGMNKYLFRKKYFESLPCIPGAGRPGENGETSFQYNLDAIVIWQQNPANLPKVKLITPYYGLGIGLSRFQQGERRWQGYDSMANEWYDVVRNGGWKPVVPTVIALIGINIFHLSERIAVSGGLTSRFHLGNTYIQDYNQTLLDLGVSINLKYMLIKDKT